MTKLFGLQYHQCYLIQIGEQNGETTYTHIVKCAIPDDLHVNIHADNIARTWYEHIDQPHAHDEGNYLFSNGRLQTWVVGCKKISKPMFWQLDIIPNMSVEYVDGLITKQIEYLKAQG